MSIFAAIKKGFVLTWRYKQMLVLLYLLNLVFAALVAYPLKNLLEAKAGHSLMIDNLIKGFDYTFLNDFNNAYGAGFLPIMNQSILVLALFLILSIFLMGGILATFQQEPNKYDKSIFWGQSAHFFWRIARLSFYFLIIHLIVFGIFGFIFYKSVHGLSPFELENEATISFAFKAITPCYILIAAFFFMWQDYTKAIIVETNKTWIFQSLWPALKLIRQNFRKTYGLYLLNLAIWFLAVFVNYWISNSVEFTTGTSIFISFLISQLYILIRFSLKLINLGSVVAMQENL